MTKRTADVGERDNVRELVDALRCDASIAVDADEARTLQIAADTLDSQQKMIEGYKQNEIADRIIDEILREDHQKEIRELRENHRRTIEGLREKIRYAMTTMGFDDDSNAPFEAEVRHWKAERDALKKDAERYRFMRDDWDDSELLHMFASGTAHWDATIDAALSQSSQDKEQQSGV